FAVRQFVSGWKAFRPQAVPQYGSAQVHLISRALPTTPGGLNSKVVRITPGDDLRGLTVQPFCTEDVYLAHRRRSNLGRRSRERLGGELVIFRHWSTFVLSLER